VAAHVPQLSIPPQPSGTVPQSSPIGQLVMGVHGQLVNVFFVHWPAWHESLQFVPIPLLQTHAQPAALLHGEPPGVPFSMQLWFCGQSASVEQDPPDGIVISVDDVHKPFGPGGAAAHASSHAVPSCTWP
jgi:hypothetical protein